MRRRKKDDGASTLVLAGDESGDVVSEKVKNLDVLVAMCNVKVVEKARKCFVNLKVRETHPQVMVDLKKWLDAVGERQLDPPPLKPRTQALRKVRFG